MFVEGRWWNRALGLRNYVAKSWMAGWLREGYGYIDRDIDTPGGTPEGRLQSYLPDVRIWLADRCGTGAQSPTNLVAAVPVLVAFAALAVVAPEQHAT